MVMVRKLKVLWHAFWSCYHRLLYDSCLDRQMRQQLLKKVEYHEDSIRYIDAA
ncbi:hypothetical protein [Paenibacillus cremeus]|uniref:hypothetical protein n=1 Tax=Paenibacillus cremeus TaxID=2163881 RepID=UPI0016469ABD|nr:hypothetical protein [Paenibacillus cremeus]